MSEEESLKQYAAFEFYLSLGAERSYRKVAEKYEVNHQTIGEWAAKFGWKDRIAKREARIREKLSRATDETLLQVATRHRANLDLLTQDFEERLMAGDVRIEKVPDYLKVIEADKGLLTEAAAEVPTPLAGKNREEIMAHIQKMREKRTSQDENILEQFEQFDPRRIADALDAGSRVREETKKRQAEPVHTSRHNASGASMHGQDDRPKWRKSWREDPDGISGHGVSLYGPVSDVVSPGEAAQAS